MFNTAFVPVNAMVSPADTVPSTVSVLFAPISIVPVPSMLATMSELGSMLISPSFTSAPESVRLAPLSSVSVTPAAIVFAPLRVQPAPLSMVTWAKSMYLEPRPDNVPAEAPDASSNVLTDVAPMVLPPSTIPEKLAPGSMTSRSVAPAANFTASGVPPMLPALTTVAAAVA